MQLRLEGGGREGNPNRTNKGNQRKQKSPDNSARNNNDDHYRNKREQEANSVGNIQSCPRIARNSQHNTSRLQTSQISPKEGQIRSTPKRSLKESRKNLERISGRCGGNVERAGRGESEKEAQDPLIHLIRLSLAVCYRWRWLVHWFHWLFPSFDFYWSRQPQHQTLIDCCCSETALKLLWNCSGIALELLCSGLDQFTDANFQSII